MLHRGGDGVHLRPHKQGNVGGVVVVVVVVGWGHQDGGVDRRLRIVVF